MQIQHRMVGEVAIIDLKGNFTLREGDELLPDEVKRLIQQGQKRFVLNLAGVPQLDSVGLSAVVRAYTTTMNRGGNLKLLHLTHRAKELLIITKLSKVIETFDSEEDAVRSFQPSAGV